MLKDPNFDPAAICSERCRCAVPLSHDPGCGRCQRGLLSVPALAGDMVVFFFEGASFALNGERVAVTASGRIALMGVRPLRRVAGARCNRRAPPSARH